MGTFKDTFPSHPDEYILWWCLQLMGQDTTGEATSPLRWGASDIVDVFFNTKLYYIMNITVCNPLLRTPLSLIVDDSCPVINLTYYWIQQRHAWKARHQPGVPPDRWEGKRSATEKNTPNNPRGFCSGVGRMVLGERREG